MKRIDLNVDIAEGFPFDDQLLEICSSANICCGEHAGSLQLSHQTILKCRSCGVRVGAHPGYPDRESMGRAQGQQVYKGSLLNQVANMVSTGMTVYIKPHGAFYNESHDEGFFADTLEELLIAFPLPLMGMPQTLHEKIASRAGVPFIREGFADRKYTTDSRLLSRQVPGAVLESIEEMADQALNLADQVDSICLHGDNEHAVEAAKVIRSRLEQAGWIIAP